MEQSTEMYNLAFSLSLVALMMDAHVGHVCQIKFVGEQHIMLTIIDIRKLKNRA